ncbi:MAG: response regulator [Deltaproteobacteria bacterium]|nr:response regulator [Deltaproteobacteria bacterium]
MEDEKREKKREPAKILFVEDDRSIRALIRLIFSKTEYEIDMAENGLAGVEMYKKDNYNIVLMDLKMPVMDGLQATREIRKLEKKAGKRRIPVIALTAHGTRNDQKLSDEAGCDDHLIKPVKKQELLDIIDKYLKK